MPFSDKILSARAWGQRPGGLVSPLDGWGGQGSLSSGFQNLGERTYHGQIHTARSRPAEVRAIQASFPAQCRYRGGQPPIPRVSAETADAASSAPTKNPWPSYPAYKFAFVCHVTADVFFNAVRAGASDMCALLGTSYTWTGSENDIIPEMVNAFKVAITNNVDGIAVAVVDPKAFNAVTDEALGKGIPVVAYNAQAPAGAGSHVLSYIGQDLFQAGVAVGKRILTSVKKGDLVGGMISVPGSLNEQPRMDGAASVFKPAGIDFVQVGVGATEGPALASIEAWYQGHQNVKFMFSSGGSNGVAVAKTIQKLEASAPRGYRRRRL